MKYFFIRRIFKYLSFIISAFEKPILKRYKNKTSLYNPVFIIGVPRSGSTLLYQLITKFFDVSYINNFVYAARENIYYGFIFSNIFFKNKKHNSFNSDYGTTYKSGLNAPNEGGMIWNKWFSEDEVYFDNNSLSEEKKNDLKNIIKAILIKYNKPFVIKNLMFSQRLKVIKEIFPDAKIIHIKRLPEYNAQSIYKARKKLNMSDEWWSTKPQNYKELLNLSLIEQSASQVYYIEKQINEDLKLFDSNNILTINYENLLIDYNKQLGIISNFLNLEINDLEVVKIIDGNKVKINKSEFTKLKKVVNSLKNNADDNK